MIFFFFILTRCVYIASLFMTQSLFFPHYSTFIRMLNSQQSHKPSFRITNLQLKLLFGFIFWCISSFVVLHAIIFFFFFLQFSHHKYFVVVHFKSMVEKNMIFWVLTYNLHMYLNLFILSKTLYSSVFYTSSLKQTPSICHVNMFSNNFYRSKSNAIIK